MIKVLLADDQALVRGALATMLDLEPDLAVVAQVGSGDEVLVAARETMPDVVLLDIQMPGKDGLTVAAELRTALPRCRVLMCTTFGRPGYLTRAMAVGASGFIVKDSPPETLVEAVRKVHAGLRVIEVDPALAAESLIHGLNPLTLREREVLSAVGRGRSIAEVAKILHLAEGTVRNHLSAAMGKTGTGSRGEAALVAEERGWL
ncbi:response regulator transcription factor [Nonomuraea jiangxiensis]|uniref:Two-component system, NarL family, response regulator DesR n=1 Tax=Nonomuraea jiangxiensis TaxID=633440 RepID=A0A1G8TF63_9ACTN|nr:response regulator transcription factor [Nonomuraea jiangxiensis]SDJ40229.1 two-component system, NarL family, response regulator DesR [Nonomuraea jiangxiensis]